MKKQTGKAPVKGAVVSNKAIDLGEIKKLFTKLANGKQVMNDGELFDFMIDDLEINAEDPIFGHLATNVMGIKKIEEITYENFEALFKYAKVDNIPELKNKLKMRQFDNELKNNDLYQSMYRKLFDLYTGKYQTLDFEIATQLWNVYLKNKMSYYNAFLAYLQSLEQKNNVHRDLWNMMLQFSNQVKDIGKDYKEDDGWPVFIDRFVEHYKGQK